MAVIGIIQDGVFVALDDGRQTHQKVDAHVVDGVDQIASLLGQVVRLAQGLSPEDARRARDFMRAASAAMTATTYLPAPDQKLFERSLRDGSRS